MSSLVKYTDQLYVVGYPVPETVPRCGTKGHAGPEVHSSGRFGVWMILAPAAWTVPAGGGVHVLYRCTVVAPGHARIVSGSFRPESDSPCVNRSQARARTCSISWFAMPVAAC